MDQQHTTARDTRSVIALASFVALIVLLGVCAYLTADRVELDHTLFAVLATAVN